MADIEKRLNKAAFLQAEDWGTEIDVNVLLSGIYPLNAGAPILKIPPLEDEAAISAFEHDLDHGDYGAVDFNLDFDLRYETLGTLIAMVMGLADIGTKQGAGTYLHTIEMADSIFGLFGTYATEKLDKIHVVPSVKPHKLTFTIAGGVVKLTVACRGDKVIDDSGIIEAMDDITWADKHNRVLGRQGIFHLNEQTGEDFDDDDLIRPKSLVLEIERKVDAAYAAGSQYIVEPRETDKPTVKLTLEFNRMDEANKTYFADWKAENEKKANIIFTGGEIETDLYYYFKFQFPRLKIEDIEYPDANIIPAKLVLRALEADEDPEGMTGITKPVQIDIQNERTTKYLD
jgi:hypothetical protein